MRVLYSILVLSLLFLCRVPLRAGSESQINAVPVFDDGGDAWWPISVRASTRTPVIISTDPVGSFDLTGKPPGLVWRHREIINVSTCSALTIYPDSGTWTAYSSSFSVTLASDTSGMGQGDSYVVPHQGAVWGIWSGGCGDGGYGAGGAESWGTNKRRKVGEGR